MDFINQLVLHHVLASHGVVVVMAVLIARIDTIIKFLLKIFSKEQIDATIDKVAAAAKAEVDKQANQTKP